MNTQGIKTYRASLDKASLFITFCVGLLFSALLYFNLTKLPEAAGNPEILVTLILSSLLMFVIIGGSYLYHVTAYQLTATDLIILRPLSDKSVPLNQIIGVEVPDKKQMSYTMRIFGNGGVFGYFGKFRNDHFGKMTWFVTQRRNYLALRLATQQVLIISPDDLRLAQDLLQCIKTDLHSSSSSTSL